MHITIIYALWNFLPGHPTPTMLSIQKWQFSMSASEWAISCSFKNTADTSVLAVVSRRIGTQVFRLLLAYFYSDS